MKLRKDIIIIIIIKTELKAEEKILLLDNSELAVNGQGAWSTTIKSIFLK